jgi:hypothetical protein
VKHDWWTIDLCFWPDAWPGTAEAKKACDLLNRKYGSEPAARPAPPAPLQATPARPAARPSKKAVAKTKPAAKKAIAKAKATAKPKPKPAAKAPARRSPGGGGKPAKKSAPKTKPKARR